MAKNKKSKIPSTKPFYKLWWFWLIINAIFVGTWCLFFISDLNVRTSIIGILSIWGSSLATIFIGIITTKQTDNFNFITRKQALIRNIEDNIKSYESEFLRAYDITTINSLPQDNWKLYKITDNNQKSDYTTQLMAKKATIIINLVQFRNSLTNNILDSEIVISMVDHIKILFDFINDNYAVELQKPLQNENELLQIFKKQLDFISDCLTKLTEQNTVIYYNYQRTKLKALSAKTLKEIEIIEKDIEKNQKNISSYFGDKLAYINNK